MPLPSPEPGLVISYAYLWRHEYAAGFVEGRKNRPCVIVLSVEKKGDGTMVMVVPITHSKPSIDQESLEIPLRVKQHLGLDAEKSWVILGEVNQFTWPGFDVRSIAEDKEKFAYGFLPPTLFANIKSAMLELIVKRRSQIILRD